MKLRILIYSILSILLLAVALSMCGVFFWGTTSYTCSRCRAIKTKITILGLPIPIMKATDYTRWYKATQPSHRCYWCWCGSEREYSLHTMALGCGRRHEIWTLPPDIQQRFIKEAPSTNVATFYALLESKDRNDQMKAVGMAWRHVDPDYPLELDAQPSDTPNPHSPSAQGAGGR